MPRHTLLFLLCCPLFCHGTPATAEERISFNDGWQFHRGEIDAQPVGDRSIGMPGARVDGALVCYDLDSVDWRDVRLPHDWAIEGPFDIQYNARCGGLPIHGVAWYRKKFTLPEDFVGRRVAIEFDGAMAQSDVFLNGWRIGGRPYGYIGFEGVVPNYSAESLAGRTLEIAVRLAPEDLASRWYPGAGIYRNVWLAARGRAYVPRWGVYVTTPKITDQEATVHVQTEVAHSTNGVGISLETTLLDAAGQAITRLESPVSAVPGDTAVVHQDLVVPKPHRWDTTDPYLYTAVSSVRRDGELLDRSETSFGIRQIDYSVEHGFQLNGRTIKFQGVCLHHDLGPLGAAVNRRATQRQLEIMKSMGVNAIRTSHNPPSPEQLELCDEMGLLVQAEAFDVWRLGKVENGYNKEFDQWHQRDLRDMLRRDRNHPSVVMWSIGNEIREQGQPDGWLLARRLVGICHTEDPSRPVTAGFNIYPGCVTNGLAAEVDLVGLNYKPAYYAEVVREHPNWIVYGSETASTVSSRGVYHFPVEKYEKHESLQLTSYDIINPPWAYPPDIEFHFLEEDPSILGEFIWTGFDYLGEPTPFSGRDNSTNGYWNDDWPAHASYFGAVDLCGFPKDRYYLYQSQWTEAPMVHVLPHWNWQGHEGQTIPVYCYTNCDEAELFLNGQSLGRQRKGEKPVTLPVDFKGYSAPTFDSKYRIQWPVDYQPGELKVVGYRDGKVAAEKVVATSGPPATLELLPDRSAVAADGQDLCFVTVRVVDAEGRFCPTADNEIRLEVTGSGRLEALGSGNSASVESFQADRRKAFSGLCLAIVRPGETPGVMEVTASGDGLRSQTVKVRVQPR